MHISSSTLLVITAVVASAAPGVAAQAQESARARSSIGCTTEISSQPVRAASLGRAGRAAVRERTGMTASELGEVVADPRGWVDECGAVFYTEPAQGGSDAGDDHQDDAEHGDTVEAAEGTAAATTLPADVLALSSRPGAPRTIYLDFAGETTTSTAWNRSYGTTIVSPPFSINTPADTAFDEAERAAIHLAWRTVAEDFAPFDVNVTTQEPPADALSRSSLSDTTYGSRVVITSTNAVGSSCGCGGVAYVDVFDMTGGGYYQPAWVFTSGTGVNGYNIAQAVSHEVGHNFGLHHDGTSTRSYYGGAKGWAPIMGASYGRRLSQWSNGQYAGANNPQDDVTVIAGSAPLLADDHAGGPAGATPVVSGVPASGLIGTRGDVDAFTFTAGGVTQLTVAGRAAVSNVDVALTILDAAGTVVARVDPTSDTVVDSSLDAVWSASLPATPAVYTALVDGTGNGSPLEEGRYDDYDSLGGYQLTLASGTTAPDPTPDPTTPPTTTTPTTVEPTPTTPTDTTVPPTKVRKPPKFRSNRKLSPAGLADPYREVIRFAGAAESVRVRGLPRGLSWNAGERRVVLRGRPHQRGELGVVVVLMADDESVRRTFRLRVR